jgi:hypothetical protein
MIKKRQKPFHLDTSFDEALKRFAQTDPHEIAATKQPKKAKKKRARSSRARSLSPPPTTTPD